MDKEIIKSSQEVAVFDTPLAVIADAGIVAIAEQAEKRILAFEKIKRYALKTTNPGDWVNEGGRPYLQDSGANKVARAFGVSWRLEPPEIEFLEGAGGHFIVSVKGDFAIGGAVIQAVGSRSSNDPFFTDRWEGQGEAKHKVKRPVSEIDRGDVIKSAVSNCTNNGVKKLLGLQNLTWKDLEEAGILQADVAGFDFRKTAKPQPGSKPGTASKPPESKPPQQNGKPEPAKPGDLATEPQGKAINAILRDRLNITDELAKMEKVAKILGLPKVPTSVSAITKAQASQVIEALNKELSGGKDGAE